MSFAWCPVTCHNVNLLSRLTGFYQAPLLQTAGGGTRASAVALLSMATGAVWVTLCRFHCGGEHLHVFLFLFFYSCCVRTEINKSIKTGRRGSVKEGVVCPHSTLKKPAFSTGACLVSVVTTRFFVLFKSQFIFLSYHPTPSTFILSITQYFNIHCQEIWLLWPSNLICISLIVCSTSLLIKKKKNFHLSIFKKNIFSFFPLAI